MKDSLVELIVDVGNTSLAFALYRNNKIDLFVKLKTNLMLSLRELENFFQDNFNLKVGQIFISSVVPILNEVLENAILSFFNVKPLFISFDLDYNLTFKPYRNDKFLLGSDVFANLVAAIETYSLGNVLVADIGTACTVFAISRQEGILGGLISSGPLINFNSLCQGAYLLKEFTLDIPDILLGKTTINSVKSGLLYQYKYLIEGAYRDINKLYERKFDLIITGGNANLVLPLIKLDFIFNIHLTIEGIRILGNSIIRKSC